MFSFLKRLFIKSNTIDFDVKAESVPEAFSFPVAQYDELVNELTNFITVEDRLGSFDQYLKSDLFKRFTLDLTYPPHAAILGYAFASAIVLQREMAKQIAINKVLDAFTNIGSVKKSQTNAIN